MTTQYPLSPGLQQTSDVHYCFKIMRMLTSAHPKVVDFGSGQGRSDFETDGAAVRAIALRSWATARISKERERRPGPKDAIYGSALN
jgi:hypothetical protein